MILDAVGRVAMLSGPARGIGRSLAERLVIDGFSLSLGGRDTEKIAEMVADWPTVEDGGPPVSVHHFDATDGETARQWVVETVETHGGVDVLINNAGVLDEFGLDDYDEAAFDNMLTVNVKTPTLLTHLTLPHLRVSGHGRVINIASLSGKRVKNGFAPGYAMSKHAVVALTHATRHLGWDDGVRATAICPALVETDMITNFRTGDDPVIDPDDIAALVSTALSMPNFSSVPEIVVNCGREDLF